MKALIITYYWPPSGGSGVQRWLKFVKYLRDFGIEPIVYTVENPKYPIIDLSLQNDIPENLEVLRHRIWEPNSFFKNASKKTSAGFLDKTPSFFGKILQYIRANYFIPDARKFWIRPSVNYLSRYLKKNPVDVVISTGPPHSTHLIALKLKQHLKVKWIADFRDPWTEIDYFHQLPLSKKTIKKHVKLEHEVLREANAVLVVGKTMADSYKRYTNNVHVITNGYDTTNTILKVELDNKFTLVHIGMLNSDRNHKILWEVLSELCNENETFANDFKLKLIGNLAKDVVSAIKEFELTKNIETIDYLPHNEVTKYQMSAQALLLLVNDVPTAKGIITGKIFEYLQAKRPILALAPIDGDLSEIISTTKAGYVVGFNDKETLKRKILILYNKYQKGVLESSTVNVENYHRRSLTQELAIIIKEKI